MSNKFNCSMQKKIESLAKKSEAEGLDSLVGIKDVKEIQKQIDSLGLTFVESGDYAGHIWGYAVYKSPKGEYLQYDYNGTNDACRSVKVYKSKQDFIDAEGYDPEKSESKKSVAKNHTCSMQKKKESLNEDATIATSDIKKALNEVANEVKPNVDEVRVEDNLDIVGPGARAEIYIDSAGDKIWWFTVKTKDNSIEVTDPDNEDHNYGKFNDIEGMKDLFKKFLQEDIKNDTISANDALKDEPEEVQVMVRELAKETGNNYGDAAIESYAPGNGVCVTFGNEEYYCYADYNDAEEASNEGVKGLLEEEGVSFIRFENLGGIEQFLDVDWFKDAQREDAEFYVSDIKESEPERYKEEFGDIDEEDAVEKCLEDWGDDYIQWFKDNFGEKEFDTAVKENNLVDLDALAEAITDADGPANELASYDGEEIELPCGYYCYRHN